MTLEVRPNLGVTLEATVNAEDMAYPEDQNTDAGDADAGALDSAIQPPIPTAPFDPQEQSRSLPTEPTSGNAELAPAPGTGTTHVSFFERTWVRVAAVVAVALILLGGGVGIGWGLAQGSEAGDRSQFQHPDADDPGETGRPGDDFGDHRDRGQGRGHHALPDGSEGDSDSTPAPGTTDIPMPEATS
jgi:hypothetical protein